MNMEEALVPLWPLVVRYLVLTSEIELFNKILKYLDRVPLAILSCHDAFIIFSKRNVVRNVFNHDFAKR